VGVRIWVPAGWAADEFVGLAGADVEAVDLGTEGDHSPENVTIPATVEDVEFFVPTFFPNPAAIAVLRQAKRLRVVQALTAGVDWIRPHVPAGVLLCNARGAHDAATAEWVVGAMITSLREFQVFTRAKDAGRWAYQSTDQLAEKTVLIVGYGSIGTAVERRLAGFEVTVRRVARQPRDGVAGLDELPGLLAEADVVVLLVPFTAQTKGMADAAFLAGMKDGALLINAARGAVVDTGALVAEVASGRLRAALDVTDPEPLPPGHPLWELDGVFITPHVGASTPVSKRRAARLAREQAEAYLRGEPLRNVIIGTYLSMLPYDGLHLSPAGRPSSTEA
jgi:phosphoglycerate dehydrogenase-like enzyme